MGEPSGDADTHHLGTAQVSAVGLSAAGSKHESWWLDLRARPLAMWGLLLVASGLVHAGLWAITGGPWEGPVTWRKPILFGISGGLTSLSMGWAWSNLPRWRFDTLLARSATLALVVEVALIDLQCWRGVASHFNRTTRLDSLLYDAMGLLILWVTGVIIVITVRFFRQPVSLPADMLLAVRTGLVYLVISCLLGIWVGSNGDLRVQAGLQPEQFGPAGVPKFPHGVVIHALQWLPLLAWATARANFSAATRLRLVSLASRATGLLLVYAVAATLLGYPRFQAPPQLLALFGVAVMGLGVTFTIAALGLARRLMHGGFSPPLPEQPV
jgi:hypothetical protein